MENYFYHIILYWSLPSLSYKYSSYKLWFLILYFCGLSLCANVCSSPLIYMILCFFFFITLVFYLHVSFVLNIIIFILILILIIIIILDTCLFSNEKEEEIMWIWVGMRWGRSRSSWSRGKQNQYILYEKEFILIKLKKRPSWAKCLILHKITNIKMTL